MTSEQITAVREQAAHIVRELGMAIHHSEEAFDERAGPCTSLQQIIEDLTAACDAAMSLRAHANTLEEALENLLFAAEDEAKVSAPSVLKKARKKGGK